MHSIWQGMRISVQIIGLYCLLILVVSRFSASAPEGKLNLWMSHLAPPPHTRCPFCGMTRSFRAMSRGDVVAARGFNPIGPLVYHVCLGLCFAGLVPLCLESYRGVCRRQTR